MTVINASTNTRITTLPAANNNDLSSIGGGAGAESTDDPAAFFYVSNGIIYRKVVSTGAGGGGFAYVAPTARNMTTAALKTMMCKFAVTDFGGLNTTEGVVLRIGSASGDHYKIPLTGTDVAGTTNLDSYPAKGGFILLPVDPNIAAFRISTTGSPVLSSVSYFGITARFASASAKAENLGLDHIDLGTGLELHTSGVLVDFVDHDEGVATNRFGYATSLSSGVYNVFGTMFIGRNGGSAAAVTVSDSVREVWLSGEGLFAAGWSGWLFDLGNASTSIAVSNKTLTGLGTSAVEDTRPVFVVTGSAGSASFTGLTFTNYASFSLSSAVTLTDCTFINSGLITQNGATLTGFIINAPAIASGESAVSSTNLNDLSGDFISSGSGHAVELTSLGGGSMNWDCTDSGYAGADGSTGDETIYVNVGSGSLTINVSAGASTPTIRTAGASVTVVAGLSQLNFTLSPAITGYEWRIYTVTAAGSLSGASEVDGEESAVSASQSYSYSFSSGVVYAIQIIPKANDYQESITYYNAQSTDQNITINLIQDINN